MTSTGTPTTLRVAADPTDAAPQAGQETQPEPLLRDLIGAQLRAERLAQERSIRQVAERARVSIPYLSEIERGKKEPSSEVIAALCTALDVEVFELVLRACAELEPAAAGIGAGVTALAA